MFDFAGTSYTYRDVQARAETWHLILSDAGAQPGARIMFLSANRPEFVHDFPGGAGRYVQRASGYDATVVNGQVFMEHGEHAGPLAGRLVRSTD